MDDETKQILAKQEAALKSLLVWCAVCTLSGLLMIFMAAAMI